MRPIYRRVKPLVYFAAERSFKYEMLWRWFLGKFHATRAMRDCTKAFFANLSVRRFNSSGKSLVPSVEITTEMP